MHNFHKGRPKSRQNRWRNLATDDEIGEQELGQGYGTERVIPKGFTAKP